MARAEDSPGPLPPRLTRGLSRDRRLAGYGVGAMLLGGGTPVLVALRSHVAFPSDLLLYLVAVLAVALVGGMGPALAAAVLATLLLNFWFVLPLHRLAVADSQNILALCVFVVVAVSVSLLVDVAARRQAEAERAGTEAATLSALAAAVLRGETELPAMLRRVREIFGMAASSVVAADGAGGWAVLASEGDDPPADPAAADAAAGFDGGQALLLRGHPLPQEDHRVMAAVAAQIGIAVEQARLVRAAAGAEEARQADHVRTALLAAVSHDLRTPLASAKASVTGLLDIDVAWTPEERAGLLETAAESLLDLQHLVDDLLDMSRLQAGVMPVVLTQVGLDDVVSPALDTVASGRAVVVDVPETLPAVLADPGLLERVIANLVQNSLRHGGTAGPPEIRALASDGRVVLTIADHGPGIQPGDLDRAFAPFQRLGDSGTGRGSGLGLAIARGFVESMGGTLTPSATVGGGLTMSVALSAAGGSATGTAGIPG